MDKSTLVWVLAAFVAVVVLIIVLAKHAPKDERFTDTEMKRASRPMPLLPVPQTSEVPADFADTFPTEPDYRPTERQVDVGLTYCWRNRIILSEEQIAGLYEAMNAER